jgi:hypothetical protein
MDAKLKLTTAMLHLKDRESIIEADLSSKVNEEQWYPGIE